jgi:RND family efflux transporter MFP subunit
MKKIIGVFILITAGALFFKIDGKSEEVELKYYETYTVKKQNMENYVEAKAEVEAQNTKKVFVDRALRVKELYFDEGDYVKKGDIIMTFDDEDKNNVLRSLEKEKISLKKYQRNLKNTKELQKIGGATLVDVEDLEYDISTIKINIAEYEEEISKMPDNIKSPFEGTITSMNAEENYRVNTEEELFEIADQSDILLVAQVPEYDIRYIELGQNVRIKPEIYEKKQDVEGKVVEIANISSDESDGTAYVEVRIEIAGDKTYLIPGFTADVEIIYFSRDNSIFVPRSSVIEKDGGTYVFSVDDKGSIKKLEVQLGVENTEHIEILNGLSGGEKILKTPDMSLKDGQIITVGKKGGEISKNGQNRKSREDI